MIRKRLQFRISLLAWTVVMVALACSCVIRRSQFLALAEFHRLRTKQIGHNGRWSDFRGGSVYDYESAWHQDLSNLYARAARYPWLPVGKEPQIEPYFEAKCRRAEEESRRDQEDADARWWAKTPAERDAILERTP